MKENAPLKAYLAGPMTGIPEFNAPAFDAAAKRMRRLGFEVGFDLAKTLLWDVDWIADNATHVVVLPGWERSKGARLEVAMADALGIPVHAYSDDPREGWRVVHLPDAFAKTAFVPAATSARRIPSGEVRSVSTTGGEKGTKLARYDLIPARPLHQLAELYGVGAGKYADRNWERGYEWSKSFAALMARVGVLGG